MSLSVENAKVTTEDDAQVSDDLTPEQREKADREHRAKEEAEQAALPYKWRQTLEEVTVTIPVPQGIRGRDLAVDIKKKGLKAGLKGKDPIVQGELTKEIKVDDSTWTLDGTEVTIHLEKSNQQQWWDSVIVGAPKIDTTKIVPENSKLSDLDGETRAVVEKMMFDQQQKQMGKPTSEEAKKMEMLEKFKKANPQMDFSKAKIG